MAGTVRDVMHDCTAHSVAPVEKLQDRRDAKGTDDDCDHPYFDLHAADMVPKHL